MLPLPRFEEVTLQEFGDKRIWIDHLGATRVDQKNPVTPGFVTRSWLEFPVKNRKDFEEMKKRYQPDTRGRVPENWDEFVTTHRSKNRDYVLSLTVHGPFWRVRDWVGFEGLCTLYAEDPVFVRDMNEFVIDFTIANLDGRIDDLAVDFVFVSEDMAYKTASMISPRMVREHMVPGYRRLMDFLRSKNVATVIMDCDGHVGELIPIWMDVGFDGFWPCEIAAHNDPIVYRKKYGRNIAILGTIDKRELRFDFGGVKQEVMSKVPWLMEQGGYIPGCDHGVPPDVPVRNFLYMAELLKALAEGRDPEKANIDRYQHILGPIQEMWTMELAERIVMQDAMEE
jgi:uroporphyrinogen decarboxylase